MHNILVLELLNDLHHLKMKKFILLAMAFVWMIHSDAQTQKAKREKESIPLDGIWSFKLDPMNVAIPVKGSNFTSKLPEEITLPGSTDQAGKGFKTQDMTSIRLTRMYEYSGAAWYEKNNVFIPENWKDKNVFIYLERAHWQTKAWVNGQPVGMDESLSTPHVYNITPFVKFGEKNTIRFRVDNSKIYDIEYTHAISAETQTNWNGIIGIMKLQALDKTHIRDVQVYPQSKEKKIKVDFVINNSEKKNIQGKLILQANSFNADKKILLPSKEIAVAGNDSLIRVQCEYELGNNMLLWDEFTPNLYKLNCSLITGNAAKPSDERSVTFGVRDIATKGTQITVNGRPTFIRGTVNSCEFPITGYPPMDYAAWYKLLKTCKDYGLNCVRFHSWCPPEAAFVAADELGLYLQVENSDWRFTVGTHEKTDQFFFDEAKRIFETYGNHPSFAFFCEGNELVGKGCVPFLQKMLKQWKQDPRHLYVAASGYPTVEGSDFYDYYGARPQRWQEGLKGRFNVQPLNTKYDYSEYVKKFNVPMVTHEIGQWCAYPDYNHVSKYVGVLKPYNYELFREGLREKNMLDQADDFHIASGKFQVIQKKEEFESYLRTPGFGGYTLLQLNDFPGQGTSPVGVVDVFYDPKPYVDAKTFSRMQGPQLPLLRIDKFTWTNNETLTANAEFINFGMADIKSARVKWMLKYPDGKIYASGKFNTVDIPMGPVTKVGELKISLSKIEKATDLELIFSLDDSDVFNRWTVWVYPEKLPDVAVNDVLVTHEWNAKAKDYLNNGGTVFLLADTGKINSDVPPGFSGISWNAVWSGTPPNLLGILCNPDHEAFTYFPTEFHSNWQWFDLVRNSKPMQIDNLPSTLKPLVQMIPDWNNNRKIGLVFEAKAGKGKLLMTSINLKGIEEKSAVGRQFMYSLQKYVSSGKFNPEETVSFEMIDELFNK